MKISYALASVSSYSGKLSTTDESPSLPPSPNGWTRSRPLRKGSENRYPPAVVRETVAGCTVHEGLDYPSRHSGDGIRWLKLEMRVKNLPIVRIYPDNWQIFAHPS